MRDPDMIHVDDDADPYSGMGVVLWILLACGVMGAIIFLSIPW